MIATRECSRSRACEVASEYRRQSVRRSPPVSGGIKMGWAGTLVCTVTLCLQSGASAEVTGDPELLRMIASGYARNYQRLQTWQGKARIHSGNDASGNTSEETDEVYFLCDVSKDKLRWYWRKLTAGDRSDEKLNQAEYFAAGLVTGQTFWKLYPVLVGKPRPAANVHIRPRPA